MLNFYSGYILKDYRTLQANNTAYHTNQQQYELGYTLRQSARLLFFNSSVKYSVLSANTIPNARVTDSLTIINALIPNIKTAGSFEFNSGVSKYFFHWKSTVSANYQYKYTRTNQVVNGSLLPFNNYSQLFAIRINSKLQNNFDLNYAGILTRLNGQPAHNNGETPAAIATTFSQKLQLAWLPGPRLTLKAGLEDALQPHHRRHTLQQPLYRRRHPIQAERHPHRLRAKRHQPCEQQQLPHHPANHQQRASTTSYPLRPRIILLKATFNL